MPRFHYVKNAQTGVETQVPFTPQEEAAADAAEANAPPPPVPASISDRQFFQQLAVQGIITRQEAKDAVKTGAIPAEMQAIVNGMANEDDRFAAEMLLSGATEFLRNHPLVAAFAAAKGWTSAQVDNLFRAASAL